MKKICLFIFLMSLVAALNVGIVRWRIKNMPVITVDVSVPSRDAETNKTEFRYWTNIDQLPNDTLGVRYIHWQGD